MTPDRLTAWHAIPVSQRIALQQLDKVRHQLKHTRVDYFPLRVQEAQARFWSGRNVSGDIDNLLASAENNSQRAHLHLLYGQLLMSCKLAGAMKELESGFNLAVPEFASADYLIVMRRHELLRHIALSNKPAPPLTLQELLNEAAVISQLKGHSRRNFSAGAVSSRHDTVG